MFSCYEEHGNIFSFAKYFRNNSTQTTKIKNLHFLNLYKTKHLRILRDAEALIVYWKFIEMQKTKKRKTGFEPATLALARRCSTAEPLAHQKRMMGIEPTLPTWKAGVLPLNYIRRETCPETESNRRHEDFQSSALPTELSGQSQD